MYNVFPVNADLLLVNTVQLITHSVAYVCQSEAISVFTEGKKVIIVTVRTSLIFTLVFFYLLTFG